MEQQMGKRERAQEHLPPPPSKPARSLFLFPHHLVLSLVLACLQLCEGLRGVCAQSVWVKDMEQKG